MGLSASEGRYIFLSQRKNDIEFKMQVINQRRTCLAEEAAQLARDYANLMYQDDNPNTLATCPDTNADGIGDYALPGFNVQNNPATGTDPGTTEIAAGTYEIEMATVQAMDKELELRAKDVEVQGKEIDAEVEAIKKVIDKAIERTYKIGAA